MQNQLNTLFLDDDLNKTDSFLKLVPSALTTLTAHGMINLLKTTENIDTVFLDHDLGGEVYVNSGREDCGMEVVRWIVENKPKIGSVVVHSMNEPAGTEMVSKLKDAGYTAIYLPFIVMMGRIRVN